MHNGAALKLTTARYYTPNDRSIQARGIIPDVLTGDLTFADPGEPSGALREANLVGHLGQETTVEESVGNARASRTRRLDSDYEVRAALNLLKGINIARRYAD